MRIRLSESNLSAAGSWKLPILFLSSVVRSLNPMPKPENALPGFRVIFLILLLISPFPVAKSQDNCSSILERAETFFDNGLIEVIPPMLADCIKWGLSPDEKIRAQKLVILAYLSDNKMEEAEKNMRRFLRNNPDYKIQAADPAEFVSLISGFRTYPVLSLHSFLGSNIAIAKMIEQYGPYNPGSEEGNFTIKYPAFQIGGGFSTFLSNNLEIHLEGVYTVNSLAYSGLQHGFAQINYKETHQKIEIPLSFSLDLGGEKWKPYLRLGASYGMLLSALIDYKRTYVNTGDVFYSPVQSAGNNIIEKRNEYSFSVVGGGGIRYKTGRGDLFFDLRYYYALSDMVNPDNRWDIESVFNYYHADSDFMLDYFAFSIGFRYSLYRLKNL